MRFALSLGEMRILRHRQTRHFVALLIGCRCGRKFLHRLERPAVACLHCGRLDEMPRLMARHKAAHKAERRRAPRAARRSRG